MLKTRFAKKSSAISGLLLAACAASAQTAQPPAPAAVVPTAPAAPASVTPETAPEVAKGVAKEAAKDAAKEATKDGAKAPAKPAPAAPEGATQKIEITGGRLSDTEERRRATASKIVIGREEIDKFGDATVGEVLRRLPGVTTPGAPGRGGPPRLRGLGNGFTQILIDGQRMPPGFSLENLTPEQVERIEILRAPTAETGARAIAGTINIISREGFKLRLNDLRLGFGYENGQISPGVNWVHNDSSGPLTYNITASLFRPRRESSSSSHTVVDDITNNLPAVEDRMGQTHMLEKRIGTNLSGRLTWRLNEAGDSLMLMPSLFHTEAHSNSDYSLVQTVPPRPSTPSLYDTGLTDVESSFTNARLGLAWRQRLGDVRLETNGTVGLWRSHNNTQRDEFKNTGPAGPFRSFTDLANNSERSLNLTIKASGVAGGGTEAKPAPDHALVSGAEIEAFQRTENRVSVPDLADFGDNLKASSVRLAAYAQDEWQLNPNWGLHAGLRWEGITTQGDTGQGERPTNRSSVWTPLLHAVYKPDPKGRDQLRISLTRSYRSPALGNLIARPTINREFALLPTDQGNRETYPDSAGNPDLKPELATGIDVAIERYLDAGGVLSANLFHRNISNLIRGQVALETVPWSAYQRWVRRQRNVGDATTTGIELEAKFRLDQLVSGAPGIELRSNFSVYDSKVKGVPGPDNRLDQQAKATANLGADYRLRGVPLTLGGNVNWVPGYTTRLDVDQTTSVSTKQVWDAYVLWTINPTTGLRLLGSNLDPRSYLTTSVNGSYNTATKATERTTLENLTTPTINWQLRLELKL